MTFLKKAISVSALGISAMIPASAANTVTASGPSYNPASMVDVQGTVTAIREVSGNDAMAGVHITLKTKTGTFDVLVGPASFLKLTKTNFVNGEYVDVQGSLLNGNVILSREVDGNDGNLTLRDAAGNPMWHLWGM